MKVLVIGSGAREHALAWALAAGDSRRKVFCGPGNAGTEALAKNIPLEAEEPREVLRAVLELGIDLVVVGPEGPLAAGVVDALQEAGVAVFGPPRASAMLECSKSFARSFQERRGIPCARTERFSDSAALKSFLDRRRGERVVLKKSGLAAGKGVLESDDPEELMAFGISVLAEDELLAEEYLVGRELSVFAVSDGREFIVLPACADHKKAGTGDTGPNTGGMGAICPVPYADELAMDRIVREVVEPSYRGMADEGLSYRGVLFFGIMMTADGPKLLEYNVRFGDPETQSLLPLLDDDFGELCAHAVEGRLGGFVPRFSSKAACGVVVAAPGYPGPYPKGLDAELPGSEEGGLLFHASTSRADNGRTRTGGGRCFTAVGLGELWEAARDAAYSLASRVRFDGAWYRPDIGEKIFRAKN
jgi:phosphoribosylamine--glycine ligase